MNNNKWIFFSFSVSAKLQGFRVKIWRKIIALGAVQIKNSLYVLPASAHHLEQLTWMSKETDEQGGAFLIIVDGRLLDFPDTQIAAAFTQARDEEYRELGEAIRSVTAADSSDMAAALRKLEKRLETIQAIDFFPSGRGAGLQKHLDEARRGCNAPRPVVPAVDARNYSKKTWVTRANPYVDRLASFWLVKRFIDPSASIVFLQEPDTAPDGGDSVTFDMAHADFTHVGGLITFEVIADAFELTKRIPQRMREVVKAIDLEELEAAPPETPGVWRMLDGLVAANKDDHARTEQALIFFDTLLASYTTNMSV